MIAITGSGEFLSSMIDVDLQLLSYLNDEPYVLSFSTAAGKESADRLSNSENLAQAHSAKIGVEHKQIDPRNTKY